MYTATDYSHHIWPNINYTLQKRDLCISQHDGPELRRYEGKKDLHSMTSHFIIPLWLLYIPLPHILTKTVELYYLTAALNPFKT